MCRMSALSCCFDLYSPMSLILGCYLCLSVVCSLRRYYVGLFTSHYYSKISMRIQSTASTDPFIIPISLFLMLFIESLTSTHTPTGKGSKDTLSLGRNMCFRKLNVHNFKMIKLRSTIPITSSRLDEKRYQVPSKREGYENFD